MSVTRTAQLKLAPYARLALDSPRSAIGGMRLLCRRHEGLVSPRDLDDAVRTRMEQCSKMGAPPNLVRVSTLNVNGLDCYLRLYPMDRLIAAARGLWVGQFAPQAGIDVPRTLQTCFTKIRTQRVFAILEESIDGPTCWEKMSPLIAESLADSTRRWHGVPPTYVTPYKSLFLRDQGRLRFPRRVKRIEQSGQPLSETERRLIDLAQQTLDRAEMHELIALSHGDVNPHNLIVRETDSLAWIDFEQISLRPIWHDLSAMISNVLRRHGTALVDLFEKRYFSGMPELHEHWLSVHADWFLLYHVIEGVKWRTPLRGGERGESMRKEWARRAFLLAASFEGSKQNQKSSADLMAHAQKALQSKLEP